MDEAVKQLLSINTLYFMAGITIITMLLRRLVETIWPVLKKAADANAKGVTYKTTMARYWNELILYALPSTVACVAAFVPITFFIPEGVATLGGRLFICIVTGGMSAAGYKLVKKRTGLTVLDDAGGG